MEFIAENAFYAAEKLNLYFTADVLPAYLAENWDNSILGYHVGVQNVVKTDTWEYAQLHSGNISIVAYLGNDGSRLAIIQIGAETMGKFILKRILAAIPTLFLALTLVFFLMRAIPGDPIYQMSGPDFVDERSYNAMAERYGLAGMLPNWGVFINIGRVFMLMLPEQILFPAVVIFITTFGFSTLGDGLCLRARHDRSGGGS